MICLSMFRALLVAGLFALAGAEWHDSYGDGTPDFLRLQSRADQEAFRGWFCYLAEAQFYRLPSELPREITDCSALLRYAYREGLRTHDGDWLRAQGLINPPLLGDVREVRYPNTPLGASLFRIREGPLAPASFGQFADAKTLMRWNTHFVARDLRQARPGDLLFFDDAQSFHSMIYLGAHVVYHTGPQSGGPGEIRRPSIPELMRFPEPRWRPVEGNSNFLGVFRWNILRDPS